MERPAGGDRPSLVRFSAMESGFDAIASIFPTADVFTLLTAEIPTRLGGTKLPLFG
jgi:hypothetical protein